LFTCISSAPLTHTQYISLLNPTTLSKSAFSPTPLSFPLTMLFSIQVATILAMSLASTQAFPAADPSPAVGDVVSDLRVLHVERRSDGDITWYGDVSPDAGVTRREVSDLTSRATCSNAIETCNHEVGRSHTAPKPTCDDLLDHVLKDSDTKLQKSPRSICKGTEKSGRCCVSWNKVPTRYNELKYSSMFTPADLIRKACDDKTKTTISGRNIQASLIEDCVVVCLSNRPDGCA
jgi:hypothetical protein